jgi:FtsP/CotA-like multicopper oxidase with cupredoxin domain
MSNRSFRLIQYISRLNDRLKKNNVDVSNNAALKRSIIERLEQSELVTNIENKGFFLLLQDIKSLLNESLFNESYLINNIDTYLAIASADPDMIELCFQSLEEIGKDLIKTGDYTDPGVGGDDDNPHHVMKYSLIGTDDLHKNSSAPKERSEATFNIPTDGERSPSVFTVNSVEYDVSKPFTQQILRLEELGRKDLKRARFNDLQVPLPDSDGFPVVDDLNKFMDRVSSDTGNIGFKPTKQANVDNPNPWSEKIKEEILPEFKGGVAEGRMSGFNGEHQRWKDDYEPVIITVTCQSGAIENQGSRDTSQMHKYELGEFGKKGLYHSVLHDLPDKGTTKGIKPKFHAKLPEQKKESLWTFDGTFPPKLLMAKYGDPHILRHYNFLPIIPDKNRGFGLHTITTHEHNGANNGVSDGFAQSFFFPGEYYDYLYPMQLAGFTHMNTEAKHPKASAPMDWKKDEEGHIKRDEDDKPIPEDNKMIPGDWKETMSTHWFHDHMLDYTAQNVYKGNAAMMNYYSAMDRGNEEIEDGVNLRLPSGTEQSWGNRDYDVNLIVLDKAWDKEGQLWFNPFNTNGFLGDRMLVNWLLEPYFEVRARKYRFRILNASVSRFMKFALVRKLNDNSGSMHGPNESNTSYERVPFWMIANCGNLLIHSIKFDGTNGTTEGILPVQAIGERFDIVVDFSDFNEGDELYFVNVLEHLNGKRPNRKVPLGDILNETYKGDPCVMKFMEFRVMNYDGEDKSLHPSVYEVGKRNLITIEPLKESDIANAIQRDFNFVNKKGTTDEWAIETDGGPDFQMDPRRLSAAPKKNATEIWKIRNGSTSWAHNVHIHYTEGRIILRDNHIPPIWEQFARKDVYRVGGGVDSSEELVIALTFNDSDGDTYMMHCHNTQHEDHAMLLRYDITGECCVKNLPCPFPTWEGVKFMETKTLPTFRTGMLNSNMFYERPEKILKKLNQIDLTVPDPLIGAYFVNGLGKSLQLTEDE